MTTMLVHTKPNTGYYKATYPFINEVNGLSGENISFVDFWNEGVGNSVQIISDLGGHNKVLEIDDQSPVGQLIMNHNISDIVSGTIEWYYRTTDADKRCYWSLYHGATQATYLDAIFDILRYYDGSWHTILDPLLDNTQYHFRIDFECGGGGYMGLAADRWYLYINEVQYGPYNFRNGIDHADIWKTVGNDVQTGWTLYIDAHGESWQSDYNVGDNLTLYTNPLVFRQAKTRRGTHCSYKDFSSYDLSKMLFPEVRT